MDATEESHESIVQTTDTICCGSIYMTVDEFLDHYQQSHMEYELFPVIPIHLDTTLTRPLDCSSFTCSVSDVSLDSPETFEQGILFHLLQNI